MKLLGVSEQRILKEKNNDDVPHLEITKVILVYLILSEMIISLIEESCLNFFPIYCLVNYEIFHPKVLNFWRNLIQSSHIDVGFTNQNSQPLDIEDKMNISLVIN